MKSITEQLSVYSSYHRTTGNRMMHFIGVPAITWALMVWLAMPAPWRVGPLAVTPAHIAVAVVLAYYLTLDFPLGVAATAVFTMLLVAALRVVALDGMVAAWTAGGAFVAGWTLQLVGHAVWEKRRPAFVDNLWQLVMAPMFLIAEAAFSLGLRRQLQQQILQRAGTAGDAA